MAQKQLAKVAAKMGRPTVITDEIVEELENLFKLDVTIKTACQYVGIHEATYYRNYKDNETFARKMDKAQHYARIVASKVVVESIIKDKDLDSARWWLEKRYKKEFGGQTEVSFNDNRSINLYGNNEQLAERLSQLFSRSEQNSDR